MNSPLKVSMAVISALSVSLLSGCATSNIKHTKASAHNAILHAQSYDNNLRGPNTGLVSSTNIPFLGESSFEIRKQPKPLPAIFNRTFVYSTAYTESLTNILSHIAKASHLHIQLSGEAMRYLVGGASNPNGKTQSGVTHNTLSLSPNHQSSTSPIYNALQSISATLRFNGTLKSLLNTLTAKFGLYWRWNRNTQSVVIFHTLTQTFHLNLLPGKVQTKSTIAATGTSTSSNVTYQNGSSDPWQSAISTIQTLGGQGISVEANRTYDMVTVTATPPTLKRIASYIHAINTQASRGVMIKLSIYDIKVTNTTNYGLDWNAIFKATEGSIAWSNDNLTSALPGPSASSIETATATGTVGRGAFDSSKVIASAIQNYTDSTYVTGDKFFSLNGQSNPISDVREEAYLKQVSVTTLGSSTSTSSDNVEVSAEPAELQTGYVFNVTPEILSHDQVRIHLSLDMSSLIDMIEKKLGSSSNPETIDLPQTKHKKLIQTFSLQSGQTAVISGFTNNVNDIGTNSLGNKNVWALGGSQATNHEKVITVIVVTPYIIRNPNRQ